MIAFRTNANSEIGLGHLFRCVHLANALKLNYDLPSIFIIDAYSENIGFLLKNFHVIELYPSQYCYNSELYDATLTKRILDNFRVKCIVVDDYRLGYCFEKSLHRFAKVVVLEDLETRKHFCDILVDGKYRGNNPQTTHETNVPNFCKKLLGPKYMILNPELKRVTKNTNFQKSSNHVLMLALGGGNVSKQLYLLLRLLNPITKSHSLKIIAIISSEQYITEDLKTLFCFNKYITPLVGKKDLSKAYSKSSVFIGALGTMAYEANYHHLPTVTISVSANQINDIDNLSQMGFHLHCEDYDHNTPNPIIDKLLFIIENYEFCKVFYTENKNVQLDLKGALRIAEEIKKLNDCAHPTLETEISKLVEKKNSYLYRRVTKQDFFHHLECRNLAFNRNNMVYSQYITLNSHFKWWFNNNRLNHVLIKNGKRICYIWHKSIKLGNKYFLVGGWFACSKSLSAIDVFYALNAQITSTDSEFGNLPWLAVVKKTNFFVQKLMKRFNFVKLCNGSELISYIYAAFPNVDSESFDFYYRTSGNELRTINR